MRPLVTNLRAVGAAALLIALAGCSVTTTESAQEPSADGPSSDLGHVHGLGVNPADDAVYVATHYGLFVLNGDTAQPVGQGRQDTMGFTVTGPDTFLASGHPGRGEEGPTNLGLLRSTDAGRSWEEVSLGGQSDFHALTSAADRVYGLDSATGGLKRSDDGGNTWHEGAALPARDLTADPTPPHRLLATTETGLMVSTDAGATFAPHTNQPPAPLVVIDHVPTTGRGEDGTVLAGVDVSGQLWTFDGRDWTGSGESMGAPQAFTAIDATTYLAAFDAEVYRSDDTGETWQLISQPS